MAAQTQARARPVEQESARQAADLLRQVSAARCEAEAAYADARSLVYDRFPTGPVDLQALTPVQTDALERLEAAEEHLAQVRAAFRQTGRLRLIRLD